MIEELFGSYLAQLEEGPCCWGPEAVETVSHSHLMPSTLMHIKIKVDINHMGIF